MKLDKRVIECGTLVAFLGVLAWGTSTYQTTTPISATVEDATYSNVQTLAPAAVAQLNAGMSFSFGPESLSALLGEDAASTETSEVEMVAASVANPEWVNKFIVVEEGQVNIRSEATAESDLVGKIEQGGVGEVLEKGETWSRISSGDVEGYIANEFLVFGDEAAAISTELCNYVTTITENSIRVRGEASAESKILGLVGVGDSFETVDLGEGSDFVAITYKKETGYVAKEYSSTELDVKEAKTMEQIRKEEAAKKAAKQASYIQKDGIAASYDEVTLLAALVHAEAGNQSYANKLGVASVVMNRVRSGRYPNNITDVIYQSGQFPPASQQGKVARILESGSYNSTDLQAAQEAISGVDNVNGAIGFTWAGTRDGIVIGSVVFF